jgi:hypothetical protein
MRAAFGTACCVLLLSGCNHHMVSSPAVPSAAPAPIDMPNPITVPAMDTEYLWNQVVDTIDDYFKIQHEERVRVISGMLTAGRIDTFPVVGATILEPWRKDSTHGFERLHSTLQSVRRRSIIHVVPVEQGFSIEVIVLKDLENLEYPENSAVGMTTPDRHDGTLRQDKNQDRPPGPPILGWIPQGRDLSLEQRILAQIRGRLAEAPQTSPR